MDRSDRQKAGETHDNGRDTARLVEWIAGGISAIVVVTIVAFLVYEGLRSTHAAPDLVVRAGASLPAAEGRQIRFTIHNRGDQAASNVVVSATVRQGDEVSRREVTVDYVPANSEVKGGFFVVIGDPGTVELAVGGYVDP